MQHAERSSFRVLATKSNGSYYVEELDGIVFVISLDKNIIHKYFPFPVIIEELHEMIIPSGLRATH